MKEIPLTKGYVALVSDEDYERVAQFKWHARVGRSVVYARGRRVRRASEPRVPRAATRLPRRSTRDHSAMFDSMIDTRTRRTVSPLLRRLCKRHGIFFYGRTANTKLAEMRAECLSRVTWTQLCAIAAYHDCAVFSVAQPGRFAGVFYSNTFKHTRPPQPGRADLRPIASSLRGRWAIVLHRWQCSKSTLAHEVAHLLSLAERCFLDDRNRPVTRVLRRCARRIGVTDAHSLASREELRARLFELRAGGVELPDTLGRFTERIWRSFRKSLTATE